MFPYLVHYVCYAQMNSATQLCSLRNILPDLQTTCQQFLTAISCDISYRKHIYFALGAV